MEILFNFCYYVTLFFIPIAFYLLFLKKTNNARFSTNRDWLYVFKLILAMAAVRKYQKKCKRTLNDISETNLEHPKEIQSDISTDSQFIYGADQKGNSLSLRFTIRSGLIAEIYLCIRTSNGAIYTFPGEKTVKFYSLSSWRWKTKDLHIEILEPFKKIRVTYNGLLSNANNDVEHVQFNLIWISAGRPQFYPQDAATALLADALARDTWRDGDWITLLGDERGYEQFGALRGFIRGDSFSDDFYVNLPSCRTRFWGVAEKLAVDRSIHLFVAGKDGTLISFWIKALKKRCTGLKSGNVIMSNGTILPITDSDVRLECLGQSNNIPSIFSAHIKAKRKTYKIIFHCNLKKTTEARNEESRGYDMSNTPADCDLNIIQAKSLVEFWYRSRGDKIQLPPPFLVENKSKTLPHCYISSLNSEESRFVRLVGGKGCSLAMLASLNCDKRKTSKHLKSDLDFVVPDGFIITVNAFNKQLEINFNIKKAVAILDDICCGRTKGDLDQACRITVETFKNEEMVPEVAEAIHNALKKGKQDTHKWAVRSSAVGEDSDELSAAGQNQTFLGLDTGDVIKAVSSCWASLFTYQSVRYRHQHGLAVQSEMAVVVQRMVPADCAGVLFTCHPSTANPAHMVITANHGLGESVVSGKSDPDTVILNRTFDNDLTIASKTLGMKKTMIKMTSRGVKEEAGLEGFCITDNQALELGKLGVYLEEVFGGARDVEWAYYQGRLYLLQSRPVTTLNSWSDYELLHEFDVATLSDDVIYTTANTGEVFPGAVSVLSMTTVLPSLDKAAQKNAHGSIDKYVLKCIPTFQHHVFLDVITLLHRKVSNNIKLTDKIVDLAVFGRPVINDFIHSLCLQKNGVANFADGFKELWNMIKVAWCNDDNLKMMKNYVKNTEININEDKETILEMYIKIDSFLNKVMDIGYFHCCASTTSTVYQILAMKILMEKSQDLTVDHYSDVAMLLSSCDDVLSAEIPSTLSQIAQILIQNGCSKDFTNIDPNQGQKWLAKYCPQASTLFDKFLQKHGHRALQEFDISKRTWAMNPEEVIKMIQVNCKTTVPKQEKATQSVDDVIAGLKSPKRDSTRKFLKFIMKKSRKAVGIREQAKSELIQFVNKFRLAYRQLGHKMALSGLIPNEDLIFHLSHHEVHQLINERSPDLISKAVKRQRLYQKWDKLKFPEISYGVPQPENNDFIPRAGSGKVRMEGTPVCIGDVQARACVITDLNQIDQLEDGDVLITHCTDIGWSPYFPMLGGIVTELGGLVSHGAVIAREYGLACIVGVEGATKVFKTGDAVLLSGKKGTIELA